MPLFVSRLFRKPAAPQYGMPRAGGARRLTVVPSARASIHADGLAVLDIATGKVFLANQTGAQIWQGLVDGLELDAIVEVIGRDAGVPFEIVRRDTDLFLCELERHGLVAPVPGVRP